MGNRLITGQVKHLMKEFPLYSQDAKRKDALCVCVFYIGNIRWYILEGQQEANGYTLYGIVVGLCATEYGYVSADELAQISINSPLCESTLKVEQDHTFKSCSLKDIQDCRLQKFLSNLYDE